MLFSRQIGTKAGKIVESKTLVFIEICKVPWAEHKFNSGFLILDTIGKVVESQTLVVKLLQEPWAESIILLATRLKNVQTQSVNSAVKETTEALDVRSINLKLDASVLSNLPLCDRLPNELGMVLSLDHQRMSSQSNCAFSLALFSINDTTAHLPPWRIRAVCFQSQNRKPHLSGTQRYDSVWKYKDCSWRPGPPCLPQPLFPTTVPGEVIDPCCTPLFQYSATTRYRRRDHCPNSATQGKG